MLWILSQNQQNMMNVKDVSVKGKQIQGFVENSFLDQWNKILGKYDSNERAVEILKEIFMKIEKSNSGSVTFTMPQK